MGGRLKSCSLSASRGAICRTTTSGPEKERGRIPRLRIRCGVWQCRKIWRVVRWCWMHRQLGFESENPFRRLKTTTTVLGLIINSQHSRPSSTTFALAVSLLPLPDSAFSLCLLAKRTRGPHSPTDYQCYTQAVCSPVLRHLRARGSFALRIKFSRY